MVRKEGDSNPRYPYEYDSLANCWIQPLTHPSLVSALTFASAKIIAISEFTNYIRKILYCIFNIPNIKYVVRRLYDITFLLLLIWLFVGWYIH